MTRRITVGLGSSRPGDAWQMLRKNGVRGMAKRAARVAYWRLGGAELDSALDLDHITDSGGLKLAVPQRRPARGTPLTVGWICAAPGPGSGGHTTLFRMVEGLEAAGHTCVLYLYDRFGGEIARHERVIRTHWSSLRAQVRSVSDGLATADAYVASSWESAHILASHSDIPTRRLYFIQDYEPYFYPYGSHYALAEDTYRFGFRSITVGPMIADLLSERFGVRCTVAEFGCDTSVYHLTNPQRRTGVVFYARPETPRRGFVLGVLALREFHRRHPEQPIHLFGEAGSRVPFPAVDHGSLKPAALAELYNQVAAGVALSFTNLSLVPDEMLACGAMPVVGESPLSRASIDNPYVRWTTPTPFALADALSEIVSGAAPAPDTIAASVRPTPWGTAQQVTLATIEDEVYGQ